jgi:single-strand DNA-binding protein
MSSRSLNKVQLIGNLTRDPELRYTPTGAAVCTIGLATNRAWTTEAGEKKEETEFHRVVAWNKLAELCSQLLVKGRKIYVEGRLRTNTWQTADGQPRTTTEVVIEDMIILDSRRPVVAGEAGAGESTEGTGVQAADAGAVTTTYAQPATAKKPIKKEEAKPAAPSEEVNPDDIPF